MFCFRSYNKLRYRNVCAFVSISLTLLSLTPRASSRSTPSASIPLHLHHSLPMSSTPCSFSSSPSSSPPHVPRRYTNTTSGISLQLLFFFRSASRREAVERVARGNSLMSLRGWGKFWRNQDEETAAKVTIICFRGVGESHRTPKEFKVFLQKEAHRFLL